MGATEDQINFWSTFFTKIKILAFDSQCAKEAVKIQQQLRRKNKMIAMPDLLIGATAKSNGLKIATINQKHFQRISDLGIIT